MIANGWTLYYYRVFKAALDELEATVTKLARDDPKGYKAHPKTKLLASVYSALAEAIPANPSATEFKPSKSFSADAANWRRVKFDAPVGSRLFFRFAEKPSKVLVSVWIATLIKFREWLKPFGKCWGTDKFHQIFVLSLIGGVSEVC